MPLLYKNQIKAIKKVKIIILIMVYIIMRQVLVNLDSDVNIKKFNEKYPKENIFWLCERKDILQQQLTREL